MYTIAHALHFGTCWGWPGITAHVHFSAADAAALALGMAGNHRSCTLGRLEAVEK